eukprot:2110667-Prymnesium_polylepis.1
MKLPVSHGTVRRRQAVAMWLLTIVAVAVVGASLAVWQPSSTLAQQTPRFCSRPAVCTSFAPHDCFKSTDLDCNARATHGVGVRAFKVRQRLRAGLSKYAALLFEIPDGVVLHEGWGGWIAD